jgi:D-arabinose 1-dehydrogenase-like Zn-dependent alcohol dehydrogenase
MIAMHRPATHWCELVPPCSQGTLKIRVSACGMGFPDLLQSADKYQTKAEPPFVPVQYAVGEIVAIGEGAASGDDFSYDGVFKVGDRVVGNAAEDSEGHMRGGLAEEALVRGDAANLVPSFMSDAVVLSMHENYWDTHHGVAVCGEVGPGDTLVVLGASGACGLAAIDLGKALGATVVACASSEEKLEACAAQVGKRPLFAMSFDSKNASFYQDRLGTNIGKVEGNRVACSYRALTSSSTTALRTTTTSSSQPCERQISTANIRASLTPSAGGTRKLPFARWRQRGATLCLASLPVVWNPPRRFRIFRPTLC